MPKDFNKSNQGYAHPTMSVPVGTFWTSDNTGDGEYTSVKLGIYGEKVTLNFTKGNNKSGNKPITASIIMDYESAVVVARTLTYIENVRKECFKSNTEYPIWSFKNTIQFTDKESKAVRTIGVFEIKTDISQITQKNTVYISYTVGADVYSVALGSVFIKDQCEFSDTGAGAAFDLNDSRFFSFVDQFRGTIFMWPAIMQQQKMFGILMSNFSAIRGKLGIPAKSGGNDRRYTDTNYSSSPSDSNSLDFDNMPPAEDLSNVGEPF